MQRVIYVYVNWRNLQRTFRRTPASIRFNPEMEREEPLRAVQKERTLEDIRVLVSVQRSN